MAIPVAAGYHGATHEPLAIILASQNAGALGTTQPQSSQSVISQGVVFRPDDGKFLLVSTQARPLGQVQPRGRLE